MRRLAWSSRPGAIDKESMPRIHPDHFAVCLLFAFLVSIVLGIVSKRTDRQRVEYAIYCFVCFVAAVFVLGWLMYFGHR